VKSGFTLIELVMVILLLAVLAAVAIPNFIDFRTDAKNAATKGSLGALRSALSIARAAIALKEDPTERAPKYPTIFEMQKNIFTASHPMLSGTAIMDPANGIPRNPWSVSSLAPLYLNSISDVFLFAHYNDKTTWLANNYSNNLNYGWVYDQTSAEIWAGSRKNGGKAKLTEDYY